MSMSAGRRHKLNKARRIIKRDGVLCAICGEPFTAERMYTFDHIEPKIHGGDMTVANLQLAHKTCNQKRGSQPVAT